MKKNQVLIHINTTGIREAYVRLTVHGKHFEKSVASEKLRSQVVLPIIEELLIQAGITLSAVTEITVAMGPGSFTGLRVGISVANALATLLDIPVNGEKTLATPQYS